MGLRREIFSPDEFYHLYSRGTDKRKIFLDDKDRKRFIKLLFICNSEEPVIYRDIKDTPISKIKRDKPVISIGSYCLMPNHFHILAKETTEGGIVKFMRKLLTGYSAYFNKKYGRTGTLFSSRFQSSHLNTDQYLKYMFSYIHLNPLKLIDKDWKKNKNLKSAQSRKYLDTYSYSSYRDYANHQDREEKIILDTAAFPEYFEKIEDFDNEICSWLTEDGPR